MVNANIYKKIKDYKLDYLKIYYILTRSSQTKKSIRQGGDANLWPKIVQRLNDINIYILATGQALGLQ